MVFLMILLAQISVFINQECIEFAYFFRIYELVIYFCMLHLVLSNVDNSFQFCTHSGNISQKAGLPECTWDRSMKVMQYAPEGRGPVVMSSITCPLSNWYLELSTGNSAKCMCQSTQKEKMQVSKFRDETEDKTTDIYNILSQRRKSNKMGKYKLTKSNLKRCRKSE